MFTDNYPDSLKQLTEMCKENYAINPKAFQSANVKRGLRNFDGSGIVAGVTNISMVHGYILYEGEKMPDEGRLLCRGYDVNKLIAG